MTSLLLSDEPENRLVALIDEYARSKSQRWDYWPIPRYQSSVRYRKRQYSRGLCGMAGRFQRFYY